MTLLCLHGNSSSAEVYKPLSEYLPDNIKLITPEFPGHGDMPHTSKEDYSWNNLKKTAIDAAKDIQGDIILYGNSLGGHIAIEVAPDILNCKGLIISGTPPLPKPFNIEDAFTMHPAMNNFFTPSPSEEEIETAFETLSYSPEEKALLISDYKRTDPNSRQAHADNASDTDAIADERKILKECGIPTLILEGDEDIFTIPEYLESVAQKCGLDHVRIDGGGHYLSLQMPERVATEITSFINRHGIG
jgi:pimeloyl-ACP methyl ester carboxylesterase